MALVIDRLLQNDNLKNSFWNLFAPKIQKKILQKKIILISNSILSIFVAVISYKN